MDEFLNTPSESRREAVAQRCLGLTSLLCATAFLIATSTPAFAQDTNLGKVPTFDSELPTAVVGSEFPLSASATSPAAEEQRAASSVKTNVTVPYTVHEGDTLGAIAQLFGVALDDLARMNGMHPDAELYVGNELRIPNPFVAEVNRLRTQVELLYSAEQSAEHKADELVRKFGAVNDRVQELRGENLSLDSAVSQLIWWRQSALAAGEAAVLIFAVMLVTAFGAWQMRRRFVALAGKSNALTRLDLKYKTLLAKSELHIEQLYRRRSVGVDNGPRLRDDTEIARFSEELKNIVGHSSSGSAHGPRSIGDN